MARPLRFGYPGAIHHIMARGDGGKVIFIEKEDHLLFRSGLSRFCGSHGWQVNAWVIMGNRPPPRSPVFATYFAEATKVKKASTGRPV